MQLAASEIFKILGVETRIRIIELLKSRGSQGVNNLAKALNITPAAVSQHLKVLRQVGLVVPEREGYWKPYSLNEEALENCRAILNQLCNCGRHPPGECRRHGLEELNLAELKGYEKKLQRELAGVQRAIARMGPEDRKR